jgi:hypothetical protein
LRAKSTLSSRDIFRAVWSGMAEVLARLRGLTMIGFSIYIVFETVETSIEPGTSLLRDLVDLIRDVLLIPLNIAIYRLLLLGEVASRYSFAIFVPHFQRLLGWAIVLWSVINLPQHAANLITSSDTINVVATIVPMVIGVAFAVRIAILFPAIAVDASGATLGSALADTSGRSWLILKAFFIVSLPLLLASVLLGGVASLGMVSDIPDLSRWSAFPRIMLIGSIGFLTEAAGNVLAARLFDWIGNRLKGVTPG